MSKILEIDCSTGESIERDMTDEELAAQAEVQAQAAAELAAAEAEKELVDALKASARAKLVAGTPLTEEEAATLVI